MSKKPKYEELEQKIKDLEDLLDGQKKKEIELRGEIRELKQIKEYYDTLMDSTEDYISISDSNRVPRAFNLSFKRRVKELLNIEMKPGLQPHTYIKDPESLKYWESLHKRVLQGERFVAEYSDTESDENPLHFETLFSPIITGKEVTGFAEITRNITERKNAIEEINKTRIQLQNIIESLPLGVHIYKLGHDDQLVFTFANPAASEILGVDCSQFVGKNIEEAFPPLAQTEIPAKYREVCREGTAWYTEHMDYDYGEIKGAYEVHAFQSEPGTAIILFQDITVRKQAESALVNSEEKYRTIIQTTSDGFFLTDMKGNILQVNEAYCKMSGYSEEELLSMRVSDLEAVQTKREVKDQTLEITERGFANFESKHRQKDGSIIDVDVSIQYLPGEAGAFFSFFRDITERKKAEKELSIRLEFEKLVSQISSGLAGLSSQEEIDAHINNALASLGKFSGADRAYLFTYYDDGKTASNTHEWCNDGIEPEIDKLQNINMEKELPWFLKQMKEKDVFYVPDVSAMSPDVQLEQKHFNLQDIKSLIVVPMRSGSRLIGSLGFDSVKEKKEWSDDDLILLKFVSETLTDVITRIRTEKMLKEKSLFLDKVIESSALSTWISDEKGTAIMTNPACLEFFGATEDEVIGKYNLFKDSVLQKNGFIPVIKDVFEKGKTANIIIDYDFALADHVDTNIASRKVINSIFTPILNDKQEVVNVIIQTIDLTEIKEMEAELIQSRKMESIGTLAGGIAHEFNNILGIIIGNTELAIEDIPDYNPALDCVREIREASLRAKDIVRQIMSFARKTTTDRKPLEIRTVVQDSLKLLRSTIPKSIKVNEEITCFSETILGNKTEIHQVIMNLFSNSLHSIKDETGAIDFILEPVSLDSKSASAYENLGAGQYVKVTVKDTGKGINPEIMDRIFDPYFTTKDIDKGLGMGLAVVYGIMKKHDGDIKIMSRLGRGTTVELLFPISKEKVDEEAETVEIEITGKEHILFVDDEPSIVKVAVHVLEKQGYKVTGLTSSREALEIFQKDPENFDLIITDMSMPGMTGDKLIRELIKVRSSIPIILSSGHSDRVNENLVKELGIMAYAMKPLDKSQLLNTVREVLEKAKNQ